MKHSLVILLIFVLYGCANFSSKFNSVSEKTYEENHSNHWISLPKQDSLVVYGVSGRMTKPELEIESAKQDAAQKISMYYGVSAVSYNAQSIGSGFLDHSIMTQSTFSFDNALDKYAEKLKFDPEKDVYIMEGVVFVRFTYPEIFPGELNYSFALEKGHNHPAWVSQPPQKIGDFKAGVGYVNRQERKKDTIMKSAEAAVVSIVSRQSTAVVSDVKTMNDWQVSNTFYTKSEGRLTNFLILEIWIDPDTCGVYTLAVAR